LTSCSGGSSGTRSLSGDVVDVVAVWKQSEQRNFERVLDGFSRRTGATVHYVSSGDEDISAVLDRLIAANHPPDVAVLPEPGLLRKYACAGLLAPLDSSTRRAVQTEYAATWQDLGTVDGTPYGVFFKAANKSLVWYDIAAFERLGVVPPLDVDGLLAIEQALAETGAPPFAVAASNPDAWTLTDWFENIYLRVAGPSRYDDLTSGRVPWTDRSVVRSLSVLRRVLAPRFLAGGVKRTLRTSFPQSVDAVFAQKPRAAMVFEGDFVPGVATTHAGLGITVDVFPFPAVNGSQPSVVAGGDVAVAMRKTKAARALLAYLATPEAAEIWAREGGFISPNDDVALEAYPNTITRSIARSLLDSGDNLRFDLSDLQPVAFGGTTGRGMYRILRDFVTTKVDARATANRLQDAAVAARPSSVTSPCRTSQPRASAAGLFPSAVMRQFRNRSMGVVKRVEIASSAVVTRAP
jgi:ABC-type glycerol-3-phosphate transport system substrate-binding protein